MSILAKQILIFSLAFLLACQASMDNRTGKTFHRYKDVPSFIKSFLNSKYDGGFLIAEPGEKWSSGCISSASVPRVQFKRAFLDSTEYRMELWGGGIAGPHLDTMVLGLHNNEVISYSIGSYQYEIK